MWIKCPTVIDKSPLNDRILSLSVTKADLTLNETNKMLHGQPFIKQTFLSLCVAIALLMI